MIDFRKDFAMLYSLPHSLRESSRGIEPIILADDFLDKRKIFLTRQVDAETMDDLFQKLYYLELKDPGKDITLFINSPGGEVTSGLAVFDLIAGMESKVNTVCIGLAASMGAMLFLAGNRRIMLPHTKVMIHDPSYSRADMSYRKPDEIDEFVKDLKKTRDLLVELIAKRSGKLTRTVRKITRNDSYFTAEEAVDFGLATEICSSLTGLN